MDISKLIVKICRHAQSMQNTGEIEISQIGDYRIPLSGQGAEDAAAVGRQLATFLRTPGILFYRSPYLRARQTIESILIGAGLVQRGQEAMVHVYEDPQLREVEHGYNSIEEQEKLRAIHGSFYYRFAGGESPADCYDRCASFIESMFRQVERKNATRVFICTHGLTARILVMRFLHLTVEQFELLANPRNCDVITIAPRASLTNPQFVTQRWGVVGLRFRDRPDADTSHWVRAG
ncbi:MAG TPA: phosphoglycerate mutase family protein [Candidatus Obscuribacterales bacterium]